ncbi:uncharacterized protein [Solanum tuberosum]|uniref:uncharacterized protein n=1 Tax=Solanum tuberosum TaxID=4113 RepID=UPI00073A276D|nr:PREDICTED: uncharacterized protein LOC107061334 [Solanum tuberosum]
MESKLRVLSPQLKTFKNALLVLNNHRPLSSQSHLIYVFRNCRSNVDTSPLQKRRKLTRSPHQQLSSSVIASHMYELQQDNSTNVDSSPLQKRRKSIAVKVRLEDYFDLSLLSATRAKMNSFLKKQSRKMKLKSEFEEFVWPAEGDHHDSELYSENNSRRTDEAIVDLKNDNDDSFGDGEDNHVCCVDPFQRFESTALMRFKR